jgi:sterol 14-demethylase
MISQWVVSRLDACTQALMRKSLKPVEYTAKDGQTYTIPRGDLVCISAAVQNTLPELFHDPGTFNPDRHGGELNEMAGVVL